MVTVLDILQQTREFVARGWTKGVYARNTNGVEVLAESRDAVCWCVEGAQVATIELSRPSTRIT